MVRKGRAAVDPDCAIAAQLHVYEDASGTVYDALLNQVDISNNHNKYYIIQLLQSDAQASKFYVWTKWGRVGKIAGTDLKSCDSRDAALAAFCAKFNDKTKNEWAHRDAFEPVRGKYTLLARDYFAENEKDESSSSSSSAAASSAEPVPSKLPPRVQELMKLICDTQMMARELSELNYDANKLPLGKLTKEIVLKGFGALQLLDEALKARKSHSELERLSASFYTCVHSKSHSSTLVFLFFMFSKHVPPSPTQFMCSSLSLRCF